MSWIFAAVFAIFAFLVGGLDGDDNGSHAQKKQRDKKPDVERPESIPTPAMLPGLIGLGLSALRQRNQNNQPIGDETEGGLEQHLQD